MTSTTKPEKGGDPPAGELKYPKAAIFILFGYLLERFVYHGLFGGAVLYMQRVLAFPASTASSIKAIMEGLIYLAPIAGAILADTYLGKARTVFIMCCGYTVGAAVFTLSSVTPIMASVMGAQAAGIGGLLILGVSAGLMKAVYSSLGADQFKVPEQRELQKTYFYYFYWMINAGAFVGQLMTAQLRDTVQCFGDDCYFLPFILLVGFMALSTFVFNAGRSRYVEAPPDPMLLRAVRCCWYALKQRFKKGSNPVDHWVDRAGDKFEGSLIADVKVTLRVLLLFCTFPLFWALFYQTSTGMIFQAKRLYDRIGDYRVPPELTSSINPLLILILIPLFDRVIYPVLTRMNLLRETPQRMITGMVFAVVSFVCYGFVNMQVEQAILTNKEAQIHIYNGRSCNIALKADWLQGDQALTIETNGDILLPALNLEETLEKYEVMIGCIGSQKVQLMIPVEGGKETTVLLYDQGIRVLDPTFHYLKDKDAEAKVRLVGDTQIKSRNLTLKYENLIVEVQMMSGLSNFTIVSPRDYEIIDENDQVLGSVDVRQDGVYDVFIAKEGAKVFQLMAPSPTHVMWLFPQYLLITIGEVLFSVSGMDFAYSEAPTSMKSVMQAANLFTITVGLWLFAILSNLSVATGSFEHRPSHQAFFYAFLMALNTAVFVYLARRFQRNTPRDQITSEVEKSVEEKKEKGKDNAAFCDESV